MYVYTNCWIFLELSNVQTNWGHLTVHKSSTKCDYFYVFWFDKSQVQLRVKLQVLTRLIQPSNPMNNLNHATLQHKECC
jgi:hypothetical protein